jgi:hypothetical protein
MPPVPLLGLFTGAREAELCQLYVDDVYGDEATSLWVIDINQREDKTLKSGEQNARRSPLHPQLVRLCFLEFVDQLRAHINAIAGHSQADQSLAVKLYAKGGVGLKRTAEWIARVLADR